MMLQHGGTISVLIVVHIAHHFARIIYSPISQSLLATIIESVLHTKYSILRAVYFARGILVAALP